MTAETGQFAEFVQRLQKTAQLDGAVKKQRTAPAALAGRAGLGATPTDTPTPEPAAPDEIAPPDDGAAAFGMAVAGLALAHALDQDLDSSSEATPDGGDSDGGDSGGGDSGGE